MSVQCCQTILGEISLCGCKVEKEKKKKLNCCLILVSVDIKQYTSKAFYINNSYLKTYLMRYALYDYVYHLKKCVIFLIIYAFD